jgi:hypothetical protein
LKDVLNWIGLLHHSIRLIWNSSLKQGEWPEIHGKQKNFLILYEKLWGFLLEKMENTLWVEKGNLVRNLTSQYFNITILLEINLVYGVNGFQPRWKGNRMERSREILPLPRMADLHHRKLSEALEVYFERHGYLARGGK